MNSIKVTIGLAFVFLIILLGLTVLIENPEQEKYENAIESIMIHDGLSSEQEVLNSYPVLEDIKLSMERIANLKRDIRALTDGPSPNVSLEKRLHIHANKDEITKLQKSVNQRLTQLKVSYSVTEIK